MTVPRLTTILVTAAAAVAIAPTAASAAIVAPNAKPLTATEGESIEHRIVTFDDAGACDAGAYTVTINWGDGSSSAGSLGRKVIQSTPATCSYDAEGTHTYRTAGSYPITATITRGAESVTTLVPGTATIRDAAVEGEAGSLSASAGQLVSGELAELRDENRLSVAGDFAAVVDWGDGSTSTATVNGSEGRYTVDGGHTYAAAGQYRYVVRVQHGGRTITLDAGTASVAAGASGPVTTTANSTGDQTAQPTAALRATPSRLRLATLKRSGVRLRLSVAGFTGRSLTVRLRDARTGRTLGVAKAAVTAAQKRAGRATVRVRFSKAALRRVRAGRSYGVTIAAQGGLPTQQVRISVR
jgi:hypothetical protein